MNQLISQIIRKMVQYKHQSRHHGNVVETKDGQRYKKECICCKRFTSTIEQYRNELGQCKACGLVSEWSTCNIFRANLRKMTL